MPRIRELVPEEQLNRDPKDMSPNEMTAASVGNLYRSLGGWEERKGRATS